MWPTDWLYFVAVVLLFIYTGYILLSNLGALYTSRRILHTNSFKDLGDEPYPPVSVIKPLAGADPNLKDNLETFFNLKYPKYELVFCIQSKDDPSLPIVSSLIADYPHVSTQIFTNASDSVVNPKINNILQCYSSLRYDLLWIVDASVLAIPDSLQELVCKMHGSPNCGLVNQIPYWVAKNDLASCVNHIYFGTQHARMFLCTIFLGLLCASGASMLLKKTHLEDVGGLKYFGQYLAEDYFIAKRLLEKGYTIEPSSLPALQNPGIYSITIFCKRLSRWVRLRSMMVPLATLLEPLSECMTMGLLFALAFHYVTGVSLFLAMTLHLSVWMTFDYLLLRSMENGPLLNKSKLFLAWWVRETLALPIFISGILSRKVQWKDREFCLKWGGRVDVRTKSPAYVV